MPEVVPAHLEQPTQDDPFVAEAIFRTAAVFDAFTSQMRRALDLNGHERLAISLLWFRGPQTMTELGIGIPLSRAAVTTLVDRLERHGLVRRTVDVADRRRTVVELLDIVHERMAPVIADWKDELMEIVGRRTAEEWAVIWRFMTEFREFTDQHTGRLIALGDAEIQALSRVEP